MIKYHHFLPIMIVTRNLILKLFLLNFIFLFDIFHFFEKVIDFYQIIINLYNQIIHFHIFIAMKNCSYKANRIFFTKNIKLNNKILKLSK